MADPRPVYIAGIGMITPVGANSGMTVAAVNAGITQFEASEYVNRNNEAITMSGVPEEVFESLNVEIDEGDYYSELYDRIIKMAIIAAREACSGKTIESNLPLVLAMPETISGINGISAEMLIRNLANQEDLPIDAGQTRCLHTGRAAGIQAVDMACRMFHDLDCDFVLLGGSDSYWHLPIIARLDAEKRVLAPGAMDGFVPGEGAGFLLLARNPVNAMIQNDQVVALWPPGCVDEPGHLMSEIPCRGDGLASAFRQALDGNGEKPVESIYSSLNGEHFWAKEYGVAFIRNHRCFDEAMQLEHPADCYGDLGGATGPVLIGLCALNLLRQQGMVDNLVFCSSDGAARAALRIGKLASGLNR